MPKLVPAPGVVTLVPPSLAVPVPAVMLNSATPIELPTAAGTFPARGETLRGTLAVLPKAVMGRAAQ